MTGKPSDPTPQDRGAIARAALEQALKSLDEIAASHIPDCPAHYAGDELAWAQRHVGHLRRKAEIARDGISAAAPTPPDAMAQREAIARIINRLPLLPYDRCTVESAIDAILALQPRAGG